MKPNFIEQTEEGPNVHYNGKVYPFCAKSSAETFLEMAESGELTPNEINFFITL